VVLEHLDGPRLSSLVRRYGPLPEQQYLPLAVEVASALHYLHRIGYVHLDVKPSNIIMGAPARLIDLSVARTVERAARLDHPIGTDQYMAPEQCDPPSTGTPGPASDVWGLGATLFEAIAGYLPFDEATADARTVSEQFPQVVDPPYELPDRVPSDVAKVVYACLDPAPAQRPLPHELAEGLQPALERAPRGRLAGFKVR
jgi:serine/threonine-protein kinase